MRQPVNQPYVITTQFGVPDSNALFGRHSGIDYAVPLNRNIYAPASGQLTTIVSKTGGNMVVIYDGKYYHRLMHNNSFSRDNGPVGVGEEVGKAGTTGLSTGVHCHWDVNNQGIYPTSFAAFLNPLSLLNEGDDMQPATAGNIEQLIGALWGVNRQNSNPADIDNHINNWQGKPFYDMYVATYNDPRTLEYAKKVYNALHGGTDNYVPVAEQLFKKKG